MESSHLFTHVYDIDTVILALCGPAPQWIETQTGKLSADEPTQVPATHRYLIEPLPVAYINELKSHPERSHLNPVLLMQLDDFLGGAVIQTLPSFFGAARPGGWLRERLKEAALEWLDTHDLIPPSMRHINRQKALKLARSVNIIIEE